VPSAPGTKMAASADSVPLIMTIVTSSYQIKTTGLQCVYLFHLLPSALGHHIEVNCHN